VVVCFAAAVGERGFVGLVVGLGVGAGLVLGVLFVLMVGFGVALAAWGG
jgi:hypothetical protein